MRSFDDQANHVEISQTGLYRVSLSRSNRGSAAASGAKQPNKYNNAGHVAPDVLMPCPVRQDLIQSDRSWFDS